MEEISEENHDLFQLPPDIIEYRDMVRKFVEKEIMPLEPDYLKSPHAGYGLQPVTNLKKAFSKETTDRLLKAKKFIATRKLSHKPAPIPAA
jgi:hypothetical protein